MELWGSKSIGEATEAQTESIKSKRKVGSTLHLELVTSELYFQVISELMVVTREL